MTEQAIICHQIVSEKIGNRRPRIGIVLGSGLHPFAEQLTDAVIFEYALLPGFPQLTVAGHDGELVIGELNGHTIACLSGRTHFYEGDRSCELKTMIRTLKLLGCSIFVNTNASGSLREDTPPGELMVVNDHINFSFQNPLVGPNDEKFGPRFFSMENVYDADLIHRCFRIAHKLDIPIQQGVYFGVLGPNFETPAEINAFRTLGADCIGMSTVPDTLVAAHCGMKVLCIAAISNYAAGMHQVALSHEETLAGAKIAVKRLLPLLNALLTDLVTNP